MKWLTEHLNQCMHGQNGHSRWNKRAATIWNEDTESARILQEEMRQCEPEEVDDSTADKEDDFLKKYAPRLDAAAMTRRRQTSSSLGSRLDWDETLKLDANAMDVQPAASRLAPGLISVASCDTDEPESLALQLLDFDAATASQLPPAPASPTTGALQKKNMRLLSLLRNVRRLESQYLESGKSGRMLPSAIIEMPAFQYSTPKAPSGNTKCSICLHDFHEDQEVRALPCLHMFHSCCIDQWLLSQSKCPICVLSP
ncbi:hypothetical protein SDRG_01726 [Saprolegnia diclina VS20]|uniref:RING-type domain-containing protein n=1 Tax=Saprolegnia diclina (strain VS20) TaxID=1156394 RepID=T0R2U5_SAPDV|nr:hypothetical protein SDRG_01726 [Saprolegnia diclina VS20]EQC40645.1 hypothetical protein SDRG_01726 [Saprolegnia diclina VS20]|eukprot:XP_008605489.1 hypothetical protein SDRG_01726 [Saprolegnia diclina VS20]